MISVCRFATPPVYSMSRTSASTSLWSGRSAAAPEETDRPLVLAAAPREPGSLLMFATPGRHPKKDVEQALRLAENSGWTVTPRRPSSTRGAMTLRSALRTGFRRRSSIERPSTSQRRSRPRSRQSNLRFPVRGSSTSIGNRMSPLRAEQGSPAASSRWASRWPKSAWGVTLLHPALGLGLGSGRPRRDSTVAGSKFAKARLMMRSIA